MAADEARAQLDEVPFRRGRFDHIVGIDSHRIEDLCELIHERYIHIPLGILDNLRGLSDLYRRGLMGTCDNHGAIHTVH